MKKLFLILVVCLGVAALATSCKKTCTCESSLEAAVTPGMEGVTAPITATYTETITKGKCSDLNTSATINNQGVQAVQTVNCK